MAATFPTEYLFREVSASCLADKRSRRVCISWGCKRKAARKRGGRCETCASRLFRLRNDDRYAYHNLKTSARKRGIGFELAFEDFQEFCAITGYLERRGQEPDSLTIDRVKNHLPYMVGNIRILTHAENSNHAYEEAAERCRRRASAGALRAAG